MHISICGRKKCIYVAIMLPQMYVQVCNNFLQDFEISWNKKRLEP